VGRLAELITAAAGKPSGSKAIGTGQSWLISLMGGGRTASGTNVTADTAMRQTTVWRCVSLLSWIRAYLPLKVYRARAGGGSEVARDHPNYRLLAQAPNGWQTSFQRRQFLGLSQLTRGASYEILQWKGGTLQAMIPVHPDRVQVYADADGFPIYKVKLYPSNEVVWLSRFEISHGWLVSGDGYTGLSPIDQNKEAVGLALAAEEYGARIMGNGAVVSGVLTLPAAAYANPELRAAAKLSWQEAHEGLGKVGKTAVLPSDTKFEPISMTSTDAQWIEMRKLQVEEICRIYGVPPELVQHTSPVSSWGTGVEQRFMAFLATTIDPMLVADEQVMQRDLFTPEEFDVVWPQYNRAALLRTDLLTRYRAYAIGRQWGWLTVNKILEKEDENPVGAEGDVLLDPMNMQRIPVDPTALLDAGGNGGGDGQTATPKQVADFLQKALTGGRGAAEGANDA